MTPERFAKLKETLDRRQPDLTVLADGVHKPHNISAILRTCDAAGIERMHAVAPDGELCRHHMMAGGARRWVDVSIHRTSEKAVDTLREGGWRLVVADSAVDGVDYRQVDFCEPVAVVLGAELLGPSPEARAAADISITIPMLGLAESLNVSVAAAVVLYEAQRQRQAAGLYETCRIPEPRYTRKLFEWAHPDIAERCRRRGIGYPPLTPDGDLAANPFSAEALK